MNQNMPTPFQRVLCSFLGFALALPMGCTTARTKPIAAERNIASGPGISLSESFVLAMDALAKDGSTVLDLSTGVRYLTAEDTRKRLDVQKPVDFAIIPAHGDIFFRYRVTHETTPTPGKHQLAIAVASYRSKTLSLPMVSAADLTNSEKVELMGVTKIFPEDFDSSDESVRTLRMKFDQVAGPSDSEKSISFKRSLVLGLTVALAAEVGILFLARRTQAPRDLGKAMFVAVTAMTAALFVIFGVTWVVGEIQHARRRALLLDF